MVRRARAPAGLVSGVIRLEGQLITLESAHEDNWDLIVDIDAERVENPALGGAFVRPLPTSPLSTMLVRERESGRPLGVLDALPLTGYPGVANVTMVFSGDTRRSVLAINAYGVFVAALFAHGVRIVHHEVLEFNTPVQRLLARGPLLEPTARLRDHAYAAGRWWDVLVYSFDAEHWRDVVDKFEGHPLSEYRMA